jgi:hypothetical protein
MTELWTCPRCGHAFRWRDQSHSCVRFTVEDHLRDKPDRVVFIYRALERSVLDLGDDVVVEAVKTYVSFRARIRFAGAVVQARSLRCRAILPRIVDHPRVLRVESIRSQHVH